MAGRRGDFLTSPEVGPLFGAVLARLLDAEWDRLGRPDRFTVVDAGAGPGTLARSVLAAGPRCRDALRYVAVEVGAAQRARHPGGRRVGDRAAARAVRRRRAWPTSCSTTCRSGSPCSTAAGARRTWSTTVPAGSPRCWLGAVRSHAGRAAAAAGRTGPGPRSSTRPELGGSARSSPAAAGAPCSSSTTSARRPPSSPSSAVAGMAAHLPPPPARRALPARPGRPGHHDRRPRRPAAAGRRRAHARPQFLRPLGDRRARRRGPRGVGGGRRPARPRPR